MNLKPGQAVEVVDYAGVYKGPVPEMPGFHQVLRPDAREVRICHESQLRLLVEDDHA